MKGLYSLWLYGLIELQRALDHGWRYITGFPTFKRSVITPNLYLGGQYRTKGINLLKKIGITGIINMRMRSMVNEKLLMGFHLLHLPTLDQHAPTLDQLKKGVKFIDKEIKASGKVYIHCREGEGRGPSMAIAYLIYSGMTYEDAYSLVKKIRVFIRPTHSQLKRLNEFERWVKIENNAKV